MNRKRFKHNKNNIRCIVSNKVVSNKEVVIVDYAVDYVKQMGYIVMKPKRFEDFARTMFSIFIILIAVLILSSNNVKADTYSDCSIYGNCVIPKDNEINVTTFGNVTGSGTGTTSEGNIARWYGSQIIGDTNIFANEETGQLTLGYASVLPSSNDYGIGIPTNRWFFYGTSADLKGYLALAYPTNNASIIGNVEGNARGKSAVDIQSSHSLGNDYVASGDYSTCIGSNLKGDGYGSTTIGSANYNLGGFATTIGALLRTQSGTDFSINLGYDNMLSNSANSYIIGSSDTVTDTSGYGFNGVLGSSSSATGGISQAIGLGVNNDVFNSIMIGIADIGQGSEGNVLFPFGKVGIGTNNPTHKLNVVGDGNITGDFIIGQNISVKRYYFNGYDNSTQAFLNTANVQVINISNNADFDNYGIYVKGNQNLTFDHTGDYVCILSPEFHLSSGGGTNKIASFWIQKNGIDVKWSNSRFTITQDEYTAPSITYQFDITNPITDNIRFMWWSDSTNMQLYSSGVLTLPTRSSIPSVLINCQKVSEITP